MHDLQHLGDELRRFKPKRQSCRALRAAISPTIAGRVACPPPTRENGGDIIWEIRFSARNSDGSLERFADTAALDQRKTVDLPISEATKPGSPALGFRARSRLPRSCERIRADAFCEACRRASSRL
jgi:hypothetical protein